MCLSHACKKASKAQKIVSEIPMEAKAEAPIFNKVSNCTNCKVRKSPFKIKWKSIQ